MKKFRRAATLLALIAPIALIATAPAGAATIGLQSTSLPAAPKRVVALEFMQAEMLAALGLTPVGMVDTALYPQWIGYDAPRFAGTVDVGTRQQPNLEAIAGLKPDLIVGLSYRNAPLFGVLDRLAPTVLFEFTSERLEDNQLDHALALFDALAALTGRVEQANAVHRALDAAFARNRARLAAAGLTGRRFVLLQELGLPDRYWVHTGNSMAAGVARRLGLKTWPAEPSWEGLRYVSTADLLPLTDTDVLLVSISGPEIGLDTKLASPVWRHVPAYRTGRLALMERNIWGFSGPMSAIAYADRITDALLAMQRR
jgi:ABC-type Fe3+-hydroxamate transport system substrate-binding protein